jgi:hypothetical protein
LSEAEIATIKITPATVYTYSFFQDKIFSNLYMKDFQVVSYDAGALLDINMTFLPRYQSSRDGLSWNILNKNETYTINVDL